MLRKILLCLVLQAGALIGVPMRPEEVKRVLAVTQCVEREKPKPSGDQMRKS